MCLNRTAVHGLIDPRPIAKHRRAIGPRNLNEISVLGEQRHDLPRSETPLLPSLLDKRQFRPDQVHLAAPQMRLSDAHISGYLGIHAYHGCASSQFDAGRPTFITSGTRRPASRSETSFIIAAHSAATGTGASMTNSLCLCATIRTLDHIGSLDERRDNS